MKKIILFISLGIICLIGGVVTFNILKTTNYMVINIDVNPSISITVDNKKVKSAIGNNEKGKQVLADMKLNRVDLDVAINAIFGSMVKNGYLNDEKSEILLSFDSQNKSANKDVEAKVIKDVESLMNSHKLNSTIISQPVTSDNTLQEEAKKNNISVGKAELINKVINVASEYTTESLAGLSINELNLLVNSKNIVPKDVNILGNAKENNYIGVNKAKEIVFNYVNIQESAVNNLKVEYDVDNNVFVYEVDFYYNNREYEFEVNAISGEILKQENDINNKKDVEKIVLPSPTYITSEKALEIAYNHLGIKGAINVLVKFDYEDGRGVYEVDFNKDNYEYDYVIDAVTGTILKIDKEYERISVVPDTNNSTTNNTTTPNTEIIYLPSARALEIAYNHAGISDAFDVDIELDNENNKAVYEIDFEKNNMEYEYVIDAVNGNIIRNFREVDR